MLGYVEPQDYEALILGHETGKIIAAIVTPEGNWVQGPLVYGFGTDQETEKELRVWDKTVCDILFKYVDTHTAFLVACHF